MEISRERLERRLASLKTEMSLGHQALQELDAQRKSLVETIWRIQGAALVLQEELQSADDGVALDR